MFCGYNSVHSTIDSQNSDIKGCSSKSVHKYCPESITQLTQLSVLKIIQPDCKIIKLAVLYHHGMTGTDGASVT